MRGRAGTAILLGGALLALSAPSSAAGRAFEVTTRTTGEIVVSWHGDPATGCQAKGTCAYFGTYELPLGNGGVNGGDSLGGPLSVLLQPQNPAIVRVIRDAPGGPGICVDTLDDEGIQFDLKPGRDGRVHMGLGALASAPGHCAGPVPGDLPTDFPSAAGQRFGRKPVTLDFSGRRTFASGGWAGEIDSTLKVVVTVGQGPSEPNVPGHLEPPFLTRSLVQTFDLTYRIENLGASLRADFEGRDSPACDALDACGAGGSTTYSLTGSTGTVHLSGFRLLRPGTPRDLASALRAVRSGHVTLDGYSDLPAASARTSTLERLPDGTQCTDSVAAPNASLAVLGRRRSLFVQLGGDEESFFTQGLPDRLRTRCPGPELSDVMGGAPLVTRRFPISALAARTLRLAGQSTTGFGSQGYVGRRTQAISLLLRRTRVSLKTHRGLRLP